MSHLRKRLAGLLLALALVCGVLPGEAGAFSDVHDPLTALAVDALRSLGIVQGVTETSFAPNSPLTRAQFCALAVRTLGMEDSAAGYGNRMLFSDAKPGEWFTGYVNMAYSYGLIQGYGNGLFGPNDGVTYGQALTILLRVLGYTPADIGRIWPDDYVRFAEEQELTGGLSLPAEAPVSRGSAALLIYNAIKTVPKNGADIFALSIPGVRSHETAILLENDAIRENGERRLMVCTIGTGAGIAWYPLEREVPDGLIGSLGTLLLNADGEAMGFLPESREYLDLTIDSARPSGITDADGTVHRVTGSAYVVCDGNVHPYSTTGYAQLGIHAGRQARLFYDDDGVVLCVYVSSGPAGADAEVIVAETHTAAQELSRRLGLTNRSFSITKNGAPADADALARYDVAYFDAAANALRASDYRLGGFIEAASPNVGAATSITVAGCTLPVLESAWDSLGELGLGSRVTLLLTDSLQVAAAYPGRSLSADMLGVLAQDGQSITLSGSGLVLRAPDIAANEKLYGSLVQVNASGQGRISCTWPDRDNVSGSLDIKAGSVGDRELAPVFAVYEWAGSENLPSFVYDLEGFTGTGGSSDFDAVHWTDTVPSSKIDYCHVNSAGQIDLLLLNGVTGNCYEYGELRVYNGSSGINLGTASMPAWNDAVSLTSPSDPTGSQKYLCSLSGLNPGYAGLVFAGSSGNYGRVAAVERLHSRKIDASELFRDADGDWFLTLGDYEVPVSERVGVLIDRTGGWFSGEEGILAAAANGGELTVWYDRSPAEGARIRIIVIGAD